MTDFTFVAAECGDWEALYIDGKLGAEGHYIRAWDVLDAIAGILPNKVVRYEIPDEVAEDGMPENLNDLADDFLDD